MTCDYGVTKIRVSVFCLVVLSPAPAGGLDALSFSKRVWGVSDGDLIEDDCVQRPDARTKTFTGQCVWDIKENHNLFLFSFILLRCVAQPVQAFQCSSLPCASLTVPKLKPLTADVHEIKEHCTFIYFSLSGASPNLFERHDTGISRLKKLKT